MSWEGIEFDAELATPTRGWQPIPGDRVIVPRRSENFNPFASEPLPKSIRDKVFSLILRPGEDVLATMHCPKVLIHERSEPPKQLDVAIGSGRNSVLAVTRSRLLLFSVFLTSPSGSPSVELGGIETERRYREFPLGHGELLSPLKGGRFTLSWRTGAQLVASAKQHAIPVYRRKPIKRFYRALTRAVGEFPFREFDTGGRTPSSDN